MPPACFSVYIYVYTKLDFCLSLNGINFGFVSKEIKNASHS